MCMRFFRCCSLLLLMLMLLLLMLLLLLLLLPSLPPSTQRKKRNYSLCTITHRQKTRDWRIRESDHRILLELICLHHTCPLIFIFFFGVCCRCSCWCNAFVLCISVVACRFFYLFIFVVAFFKFLFIFDFVFTIAHLVTYKSCNTIPFHVRPCNVPTTSSVVHIIINSINSVYFFLCVSTGCVSFSHTLSPFSPLSPFAFVIYIFLVCKANSAFFLSLFLHFLCLSFVGDVCVVCLFYAFILISCTHFICMKLIYSMPFRFIRVGFFFCPRSRRRRHWCSLDIYIFCVYSMSFVYFVAFVIYDSLRIAVFFLPRLAGSIKKMPIWEDNTSQTKNMQFIKWMKRVYPLHKHTENREVEAKPKKKLIDSHIDRDWDWLINCEYWKQIEFSCQTGQRWQHHRFSFGVAR